MFPWEHNDPDIENGRKKEEIMKFRDLFLPKIARSDPKIRKEAVREETNADLLKKVIENDTDQSVREVARQRIAELSA
jgi:hypothetical protein